MERSDEAIAAARDSHDRLRAKQLAQGRDVHFEVVLGDDDVRPYLIEQLVLAHHAIPALDERQQQIEGPAAELDRPAICQQPSLHSLQGEFAEAVLARSGFHGALPRSAADRFASD